MKAIALAALVALSAAGCAVSGTELRSMPALGPELARVHRCPKIVGLDQRPEGGAKLCFSFLSLEVTAEAMNAVTLAQSVGFLVPMIPLTPHEPTRGEPLEVNLSLATREPYRFDPWRVTVLTARGETIRVSRVRTNVRAGGGVHTVELDPNARGPMPLSAWFFLTFERHVPIDQEFALTLALIGPDGADVPTPLIRFKRGQISYSGSVP
ncbi:MAG TPA: hypothetical protein VHJ20_13460 [Polyangia bacterium]|nr:hypothetical protein [Polyangia bacterium]